MSHPLMANMISFIGISNFSLRDKYILTLRLAHWDILDDILALQYGRGKPLFTVLIASVTCLHFNMQEEDTLEHTYRKCHLCTL
jgi:hypothetical protein